MTSACLGNFGAYKLFYWNEHKRDFDFEKAEARLRDEIALSEREKQEPGEDRKEEPTQQDLDRFALNNRDDRKLLCEFKKLDLISNQFIFSRFYWFFVITKTF